MRSGLAALVVAVWAGAVPAQTIISARLSEPTDRYPHRVMGEIPEHQTLEISDDSGRAHSITHRAPLVFEDIAPRLVDLDGDGRPEVLTVESNESRGARVAIYGFGPDGRFGSRGAGPFIGQRFRWMGVIGVADLDGDGRLDLALIDRPHLARVLRVYRIDPAPGAGFGLTEIATLDGVTNHRIGDAFLTGGLRHCDGRSELVLASGDWQEVLVIGLDARGFSRRSLGPATPSRFAAALNCAQ